MKVIVGRRNTVNKRGVTDKEMEIMLSTAEAVSRAVEVVERYKKKKVKVGVSPTVVKKNGKVYKYPKYYIYIPMEFVKELSLSDYDEVYVILDKKSKALIIKPIKSKGSDD